MTLSVAACFPWGRLKSLNDSLPPENRMEEGVILATDSRFRVERYPSGRYQYVETGRKLYPLDAVATAVFAGEVWAAQDTLRWIRRYRSPRPRGRAGGPVEVVRFFLERSYRSLVPPSEIPDRPLCVLIGTLGPGGAEVLRFASPTFNPLAVRGVTAAGWPQDIEAFERHLYTNEAKRWEESRLNLRAIALPFVK